MFIELFVGFLALVGYFYWRFKQNVTYWESLGVKSVPNPVFPIGNSMFLHYDVITQKKNVNDVVLEHYNEFKEEKFFGAYGMMGSPILVVNDLDLVKAICIKDFSFFVDRNGGMKFATNSGTDNYWIKQLINLRGSQWKEARSTFTPIFTSGKMKLMTKLIEAVSNNFEKEVEKAVAEKRSVDLRNLMGKFSMDSIASCAFRVDAESFTNDNSEFVKHAKNVFSRSASDFVPFFLINIPGLSYVLDVMNKPIFKVKEAKYFSSILLQAIRDRRNQGKRNDLIDMMVEAIKERNSAPDSSLDEDLIVANAILILVAGYDTTGLTLAYALYQLALNPDIQVKLQEEIDEACEAAGGKMPNYDDIHRLEYLDMVIHETLRLYSPSGFATRAAVEDYKMPNSSVTIKKGQDVYLPFYGIHKDSRYYDSPNKFDPEHFSRDAKSSRHPMAFVAFGQGQRSCIGMRFALLEMKMALISLLSRHDVVKCNDTPLNIRFNPQSTLSNSLNPLIVKFRDRENPTM